MQEEEEGKETSNKGTVKKEKLFVFSHTEQYIFIQDLINYW